MDIVTVSDGPVSAADGATLNGFVADVEYTVADSAANIVANSANLSEADHIQVVDNVKNSADISQADVIENTGHALTTYGYSILDTTQNLIDIQKVVTPADVTAYQNNLTGVGTDVTPMHLYNYVLYAPTTADVNPSTNSTYTTS